MTVRAFFDSLVWYNLIRKKTSEDDLSEGIASHLELLTAKNPVIGGRRISRQLSACASSDAGRTADGVTI